MQTNRAAIVVILLLAAAFAAGVTRLFNLRFVAGDVYPPYSSLRTDPLGSKALFESIESLPEFAVTRNYEPVAKLAETGHRTIFFFGISDTDLTNLPEQEAIEVKRLLLTGNRVVVTLLPVWEKDEAAHKKVIVRNPKKFQESPEDETNSLYKTVSLEQWWGFKLDHKLAATNALWHTPLYFAELKTDWQTLAVRDSYPAIIERKVGTGSLVLCVDSYLVSNEAMRSSRQTELLSQLIGPNQDVIFDEVHLGVTDDPGVSTLARRYGLHGLVIGLVVLVGLFIWKNACSFLPPFSDSAGESPAVGRDSAAGFVNLLRRSIPASNILPVCVAEWQKSFAANFRRSGQKLARINAIVSAQDSQPNRQREPVTGYRAIAAILKERK